jgi:hypothetical protein
MKVVAIFERMEFQRGNDVGTRMGSVLLGWRE